MSQSALNKKTFKELSYQVTELFHANKSMKKLPCVMTLTLCRIYNIIKQILQMVSLYEADMLS